MLVLFLFFSFYFMFALCVNKRMPSRLRKTHPCKLLLLLQGSFKGLQGSGFLAGLSVELDKTHVHTYCGVKDIQEQCSNWLPGSWLISVRWFGVNSSDLGWAREF